MGRVACPVSEVTLGVLECQRQLGLSPHLFVSYRYERLRKRAGARPGFPIR
jgi:hypothetical protein